GKLPVTFPRSTGQIPIFYNYKNTGRPFDANNKYTSKYLDIDNSPLFPFGYGLSYTTFEYSNLRLSTDTLNMNDTLVVNVTLKNTGKYKGTETAQLYIHDKVGSVTRPVKELKGFCKVNLNPDETIDVSFKITKNDLAFWDINMNFNAEPGEFEVFVGGNSLECLKTNFWLK
ncbi:MAG TPA: fibronectin type III-like domain-contianing protein, partial [Bacteroidales bacterium]|nr:fibronectin type III-like domain-contianing protein [Bacteroidales bacterium]